MQEFQDETIKCECGEEFKWTSGEQHFIHRLLEEGKLKGDRVVRPKRCPPCREAKKKRFEQYEKN